MGSDRWAEYVLTRYRELVEKERTLKKILHAVTMMEGARTYCGSALYIEKRKMLTFEFQERQRRDEKQHD